MHSVKALLERQNAIFSESSVRQASADAWQERLAKFLPQELAGRVSEVLARSDELVVYAESAVWAARLRFALAEAESQIRAQYPQVGQLTVRVLPRSAAGHAGRSGRKM